MAEEGIVGSPKGREEGDLTPEQVNVLAQVAARVRNGGPDGPPRDHIDFHDPLLTSDHYLLRFIRARQWDVEKACQMLNAHFKWRVEVDMVNLINQPFEDQDYIKRFYPHGYHGCDKSGRSVYIERIGNIDMPRLLSKLTPEQIVKYFIRECEIQLRVRLPACSLAKGEVVDRSLNILDLNGLSFRLATHTIARKVLKQVIAVQQDNYPEMMGNMVLVNAPRVFSLAWSAVKPMLDEKTVSKCQIFSSDYKETLYRLMDPNDIPDFLEGKCMCLTVDGGCMSSNKGPWQNEAIVKYLKNKQHVADAFTPEGAAALKVPAAEAAPELPAMETAESIPKKKRIRGYAERDVPPEVLEIKKKLDEMVSKHEKLETEHMNTLRHWAEDSKEVIESVGRHAIERAQGYYDAQDDSDFVKKKKVVKQQTQAEYTDLLKRSISVGDNCIDLAATLTKAEAAFHAFLLQQDGDLPEEEWKKMVPGEPPAELLEGTKNDHQVGKLTRAWRVNEIGNKVSELQRKRDQFIRNLRESTRDCEIAHSRFEEQEQKHINCSWNCSVQRSKPFYDKRRVHEETVDDQLQELEKLQKEINSVRGEYERMLPRADSAEMVTGDEATPTETRSGYVSPTGTVGTIGELKFDQFYIDAAKGGDAEDDFHSVASD